VTGLDSFWAAVDQQLGELRTAASAADVLRILASDRNPYGRDHQQTAFFAGDGDELWGALATAGWQSVWAEASYHFAMRAPDGTVITYVEGDVFGEDQPPLPHG
jgi:hypothetical protein